MPANSFDSIVIGSGPAGMNLAYMLHGRGQKVAVIEKDHWGGACPNEGCDPTKILMSAVEVKMRARYMGGLKGELSIDWQELMARKDAFSKPFSDNALQGLKSSGITTIQGIASFDVDGSIVVNGTKYEAENYIIATGQRSRMLDIEGAQFQSTSREFLELSTLPETMAFLGTGPVSLELAQIANAAGCKVTMLALFDLTVNHFDKELGDAYINQLKKEGILFEDYISISKIEKAEGKLKLSDGKGFELLTDYVVSGIGRIPDLEEMNLANVGVEANGGGIVVNEYLQTANPKIYAIGDIVSRPIPKQTPVSGFEAAYLAHTLGKETKDSIHYPVVPSIIFGSTKFAQVGQTEATDGTELKSIDMTGWYTYKRIADPVAKIKIVTNGKGEILGATILSTVADELVNLLAIAIEKKITEKELGSMILAYPTVASDWEYLY